MQDPVIPILWQDESALVVDKPAGLLVHNSRYAGPRERTLHQILKAQLGQPVFPVHRLDRATSGILLYVWRSSQAQPWHRQLQDPSSEKTYVALVRGYVTEEVGIDHALKEGTKLLVARSRVIPLLQSKAERCSMVGITIETGRRHQVRRHLRHISHPILGDTTYGRGDINRYYRANFDLHRLALHAWTLKIRHPGTSEHLTLRAPIPPALMQVGLMLFGPEMLAVISELP